MGIIVKNGDAKTFAEIDIMLNYLKSHANIHED